MSLLIFFFYDCHKLDYLHLQIYFRVEQGRLVYSQKSVYRNSSFVIRLLHFCSRCAGMYNFFFMQLCMVFLVFHAFR